MVTGSDDRRSATVRCTDDTVLLCLSKQDLPQEVFGRVDDKRLSYGVSTTMLSFAGVQDYCCMAPGVVIHPDFWFCRYKDILMSTSVAPLLEALPQLDIQDLGTERPLRPTALLILYSCTWEPFKAAFAEGDELNNISDLFVDLIYWADIIVNFVTGYRTNNDVELDVNVIAKAYVTSKQHYSAVRANSIPADISDMRLVFQAGFLLTWRRRSHGTWSPRPALASTRAKACRPPILALA